MMVMASRVQGTAQVRFILDTDIGLRVAEVQLGACGPWFWRALGPEEAIGRRGCTAHNLLLGQWGWLCRATGGHVLRGAGKERNRSKQLLPTAGGGVRGLR